MHIICEQKKLVKGISTVLKGISSKSTMPVLKGIYLEAKNSALTLIATDMEIGIETKLEAEILNEGEIVLNAQLLNEIIRKLPHSQIEIKLDGETKTQIKCEQSEFTLINYDKEEFPSLPEIEENLQITIPRDLLKSMIDQTIFAVSQDESRLILTGGLMEIEGSSLNMVALDGYRLALRKGEIVGEQNHHVVIPGKTLNEVSRIMDDGKDEEIDLHFTDQHLLFDLGETKVISRLLEGEFIDYKQILPKEHQVELVVHKESLLKSIERASLMAKEGNNRLIKLKIQDQKLHISSNSEHGQVHEKLLVQHKGDNLEIAFNAKYLMDSLKVVDEDEVKLLFTSNVSPGIITSPKDDHYTYLILPVRLSNH